MDADGELPISLCDVPDVLLMNIFGAVDADTLARCGMSCRGLKRLCHDEEELWQRLCEMHKYGPGAGSARAHFGRCAARRCHECRRPTQYVFKLLSRRLCEPCERSHPHEYGLATEAQLMHERSADLQALGERARVQVFRSLPSLRIADCDWYLRPAVVAAAAAAARPAGRAGRAGEAVATEPVVQPSAEDETERGGGESAERGEQLAARRARELRASAAERRLGGASSSMGEGSSGEAEEGAAEAAEDECFTRAEGVVEEWEAAAAEHRARQSSKAAAKAAVKAEAREAAKHHKKKVKAEQRERRQGAAPPSKPMSPCNVRAPKRPSARHHRASAGRSEWDEHYAALEQLLGESLAGLSGLVLADVDA